MRRRQVVLISMLVTILTLLTFTPALAMHISEGILPAPWAVLWTLLALPFVAWGLRDLRIRSSVEPHLKAMLGLVGAAVFVISCMPIPVPTAGTCSHPCGTGMAAILLGPTLTVVVASVALTLQALFLAHGGITTLGADIISMGVAGAFIGYGAFFLARKGRCTSPGSGILGRTAVGLGYIRSHFIGTCLGSARRCFLVDHVLDHCGCLRSHPASFRHL
jgi:ABC-type Co2+ transport system permease subunit